MTAHTKTRSWIDHWAQAIVEANISPFISYNKETLKSLDPVYSLLDRFSPEELSCRDIAHLKVGATSLDEAGHQSVVEHALGAFSQVADAIPKGEKFEKLVSMVFIALILHDQGKLDDLWCGDKGRAADILNQTNLVGFAHQGPGFWAACHLDLPIPVWLAIGGHHRYVPSLEKLRLTFQEFSSGKPHGWEISFARLLKKFPKLKKYVDAVRRWNTEEYRKDVETLYADALFVCSCLVDGDYLDTESWYDYYKALMRMVTRVPDWDHLIGLWEKKLEELSDDNDEISRLRTTLSRRSTRCARKAIGQFLLIAPTGTGKTMAELGFALYHAKEHNLSRIVVTTPFIKITNQTCQVYRDIFGDDVFVLEDHSQYEMNGTGNKEQNALGKENWDCAVIVTTMAQLFDSLLSNRPGRIRKVWRLARSVLVLDEPQNFPEWHLMPILRTLDILSRKWDMSVLYATATMPPFRKLIPGMTPVVREYKKLAQASILNRVGVRWFQSLGDYKSYTSICKSLERHEQVFCVVNTRRQAWRLYKNLLERGVIPKACLYLMTSLNCGAQEAKKILQIQSALAHGERCVLIATTTMEAGVDFDFPVGYRFFAPFSSLVQTAGRINRHGKRQRGILHVVLPEDHSLRNFVGNQLVALQITQRMFESYQRQGSQLDINNQTHVLNFYERFYREIEFDKKNLEEDRRHLRFEEIGDKFRYIDQDTVGIIVPYGEGTKLIQELLSFPGDAPREFRRRCGPYIVGVEEHFTRIMKNVQYVNGMHFYSGRYDGIVGLNKVAFD